RLAELERDLAEREARKLAELDRRIEARQREPNGKRKRRRDRQRRVPRPWKYAAPVLAVIGLGLGALAFAIDPDRAEVTRAASEAGIRILLAGGALVVSVALAMWLSRPPFEAEDTHDGATARHPTWAIGKVSFWAIFVGAMVVLPTSFAPRVAAIGFAYVALVGLGLLGWCLHRHRRRLRLARLLLVARDRTGRDGYGRFEAIVQSNTKQVAGRTVDYVQKSRSYQETVRAQDGTWTTRTATDYWLEARPSSTGLGHLVLRSDDETVTIGGKRALWGAPLAWQPTKQDTRFRSEARISDGDHVVVLGRVELEDERPIIRANGKEALVMFGAREAPRRTLAVLTLNWVANATLLVGISAACLGYALHLVTHSAPTTPASAPYRGPAEQP
ncbi:MAG: hypothetical protein K8M05_17505, partial [Deltaproteobacteria bacterium]|nr:hypothetical protein [Kofleriaceae bacterium]